MGTEKSFSRVILTRGLSQGHSQDVGRKGSFWGSTGADGCISKVIVVIVQRLWFHIGSWVGGLSSSFHAGCGSLSLPLHRAAQHMDVGFPQNEWSKRQRPQCLWMIWTPKFCIITSALFYSLETSHQVHVPLWGRETWSPPLDGDSSKEFVDIFLKTTPQVVTRSMGVGIGKVRVWKLTVLLTAAGHWINYSTSLCHSFTKCRIRWLMGVLCGIK